MIVKNESHVIRRCLDSVKHLIDTWIIVDTGSTDGTQDVIKEHLKEIPGKLHERPWVNFAHNRNEAMHLALGKADYLLIIDADDRLVFTEEFVLPKTFESELYCIIQREKYGLTFREHHTIFLIKNNDSFEWEGVLHEFIKHKKQGKAKLELLSGVLNEYINDGSRSKNPNKVAEDISVLKRAIEENPSNSRYVFYLARTYWSMRDYKEAIPYFKKRAEMGGDPMEVYYCLLYIGIAQQNLNFPHETFINSLCAAFVYRPSRIEALYEVARHFASTDNHFLGYLVAKFALSIPPTTDNLFVESWVHDWGTMLYFFVCSKHLEKHEEARAALRKLLNNPRLPKEVRVAYTLDKLATTYGITEQRPFLPASA
jgi:glycosyltransferase involved in cell wall biosynthesis